MTYNVFSGTLNPTHFTSSRVIYFMPYRIGQYHENERPSKKLILGTNVPGNKKFPERKFLGTKGPGNDRSP